MSILYVTYALDSLLTIAFPIVLAVIVTRKYDLYWGLFWKGIIVFALAQIAIYLVNTFLILPSLSQVVDATSGSYTALILGALILGLCIALFQGLLCFVLFRWWAKDARSWVDGILTGIGAGSVSAIFIGALILYNFINMITARNADLSTMFSPDQLPMAQTQISAFWSAPWYTTLNDFIQQLFLFFVQVALVLVVLQIFTRRQWFWLILAVVGMTIIETSRIIAQNLLTPLLTDLVIIGFGLASIAVIIVLRPPDPTKQLSPEASQG